MKMYRAIIRNTRYKEGYCGSVELFKTKKSLREWFEMRKVSHFERYGYPSAFNHPFNEVLVGIEEVEAK